MKLLEKTLVYERRGTKIKPKTRTKVINNIEKEPCEGWCDKVGVVRLVW